VVTFAVVGLAAPAHAAAEAGRGLAVTLTVDRPVVTVDRDAPQDQTLAYEIVVTNLGDDVVPGVVVEARVLGGTVTQEAGDLVPGGEWRAVVTATVPAATTGGGPFESVAVARSADGRGAASAPVRTDVQVISSAVYDRDTVDPPPAPAPTSTTVAATQVLGAMYQRPLPTTLARTGAPTAALAALGVALVLLGGLVVRRAPRRG
jgi:LPXTG-motif cell wall-anchored protein